MNFLKRAAPLAILAAGQLYVIVSGGFDLSVGGPGAKGASPQTQRTAQRACEHFMRAIKPPGGISAAQEAEFRKAALANARCMRSHGVPDFPDPDSPRRFKAALDPSSSHPPAFQSAQTTCRHLLPASRAPRPSAAQTRARVTAALAFARCLRGHGFPRFPDPTSTGELSHETLAGAGIDVHQPALLRAADACVSVTHGAITKADVARFAAAR